MIPRSKLAHNLATAARRSALASRQYATAASETTPSTLQSETTQTRSKGHAKSNSTVYEVQTRVRKAERDERADMSAVMTEVET